MRGVRLTVVLLIAGGVLGPPGVLVWRTWPRRVSPPVVPVRTEGAIRKGFLKVPWAGQHQWVQERLKRLRMTRERIKGMAGLLEGFVDTGQRVSITCSGEVQALMDSSCADGAFREYCLGNITEEEYFVQTSADKNGAGIAGWNLLGTGAHVPTGEIDLAPWGGVLLIGPNGFAKILVAKVIGPLNVPSTEMSDWYAAQSIEGSYILGVKYTLEGTSYPHFGARDGVLEYRWFADANTVRVSSCAGYSETEHPHGELTDCGHVVGYLGFGGMTRHPTAVAARLRGLTCQGAVVDTTGLRQGGLRGLGGGAAEVCYEYGGTGGGASEAPPVRLGYDLRLIKFGCGDWPLQIVDTAICTKTYDPDGTLQQPWREYLDTPMTEEFVGVLRTWASGHISGWKLMGGPEFYIPAVIRAAQDPPLPDNDAGLAVRGATARMSPSYQPFTLGVLESLPVHRPDGNLLSSYVSSDVAKLQITEGPSTTTFTVKAPGAVATRTLQTTWRTRHLDKTSPEWDPAAHRYTKHVAGDEDIWSWSTFAFLKLAFRCPVACQVQMRLDWTHVAISDPYVTGSERQEEWEAQEHAGSSVYTFNLQAQPNADQEARIDLLFPDAGGPVYLGRIDRITLAGLVPMPDGQPATIVLKDAALDSGRFGGELGPAYLKLALGPPVQRGDYSVPVISRDGAFVFGNVTDREYKANETGEYGGGTRHTEPMTGAVTGIILDTQKTVAAFVGELAGVEGVVAVYNEAAYLAANSDGTNTLSPENTDWIHPVVPFVNVTPGEAYAPPCSPCCRKIMPVNAIPFTVWVNRPLQAGIEVLAHASGKRAPAGAQFQAVYHENGEKKIVPGASGVTDLYGYAVVAPIPANGIREYDVEQVV